ncbi:DUF4139 domain-containing protein [Hymenobacter sediminicola]|uniref:DUF4139 domain-containing protein n=1 Tax=Hymenobacter sediminicola TaxID=2761579 RepID=A0A7G7WC12_9BACT|nr:DUF4139 domain-containing protein [Hymenobacter sediminicola]QNH63905.1 DUF4139 domain-containing protein [Hymenobacter sediminicola]
MSKYYSLLLASMLLALRGRAQTAPTVRPALVAATLYLNGTTLEHQAQVTLTAGQNRLALEGLSPLLDPESVEIELGPGAELLSVSNDEENANPVALNQAAADSLGRNMSEQARVEADIKGLEQERTFLLANQTLPTGTQANWSAEVQKGATLMRTRLPAIQQELGQRQATLARLQRQAGQLSPRAAATGAANRLVVQVRATRPFSAPLTVRYYVPGAQPWSPDLAIRANGSGRELKFVTRGQVRNQSGLPWARVRVVLSRQDIGRRVARPVLEPWELHRDGQGSGGEGRVDKFVVKGTAKGRPMEAASSRYEVAEPVTLAAGGRRELTLSSVDLAARPEYLAIPRLSEHVFLQAKVTGWQGLQLPDAAKVYYRGAYVGSTQLDGRAFNDSLEVALGHDEQLVVSRAKLEDFSENVALSDKRRVHLTYELNVLNNHPTAVRVRVLDEVPISADKEIVVKVLDISGAQLDERTGKLTWLLTLAPGASQRLKFGFQVDYPKDENVEIIRRRTRISAPKTR